MIILGQCRTNACSAALTEKYEEVCLLFAFMNGLNKKAQKDGHYNGKF